MLVRFLFPAALLILAACILAGCAAAVPGYTPPPLTENKNKFLQPMESGDVGPDGRYYPSETEKAMDCKRMTGSMQITISRLRDASGRAEPSAIAMATQKTIAPVVGGSSVPVERKAVNAREYAKLEAYNRELAAKNCKTLDIDAELARPPESAKKY
jgi:hypothetical protein